MMIQAPDKAESGFSQVEYCTDRVGWEEKYSGVSQIITVLNMIMCRETPAGQYC